MGFSGSAPENKPAAAPVAAAPAASAAPAAAGNDVIAVIAAAIAACAGGEAVACVPRLRSNEGWTSYARVEGVTIRNQVF